MNRSEFIKEIMCLYPHTFDVNNEEQYTGWIKRYQQLPESWNYDKLMVIFSRNWHSTREAPAPSWFMQYREDVRPNKPVEMPQAVMTPEEKEKTDEYLRKLKKQLFGIANKHKIPDN